MVGIPVRSVFENLLASFANVKGRGDDAGDCPRGSAGKETVNEDCGVVLVPCVERVHPSQDFQLVFQAFISPPVKSTKGHIAPHGERQSTPERGVALSFHHFP